MNMLGKVKKAYDGTKRSLDIARNFGIKQGILDWGDTILLRGRGKLGQKCCMALHENVKEYLFKEYKYLLDGYENVSNEPIVEDSPIWIFWSQGKEKAPDIVRACIHSIEKNAGKHPVIVINEENFKEYAKLPDTVIAKMKNGTISFAHFADILRLELLYRNGGIWMDATLFASGEFTGELTGGIFTIRHGLFSEFHVCKGLWSTFFLASGKNNSIIKLFRDIFYAYCEKEESIVTYFLIDCIIAMCYEKLADVRQQIDAIPVNNINVFELLPKLAWQYDENVFNNMRKNTALFKLSYKNSPDTFAADSFYKKIVVKD